MEKKQPFIARSSVVPVLACIAALLLSANFYQFLQKNLKKWWGWDFSCPNELVIHGSHDHPFIKHHERFRHRPHRPHRHERAERHVIVLDMDREHAERALERAKQGVERAEHALERNLERAMRDLERLRERAERDGTAPVKVERLEEEIRIKAENLERLQRVIEQRLEAAIEESIEVEVEDEQVQEFSFDVDDGKVAIIIKKDRP